MSKKTFLAFIILLVLVIAVFGWYFFYGPSGVTKLPPPVTTPRQNVFPFGQGPTTPKTNKQATTTQNQNVIDLSAIKQAIPRLREISANPIGGEALYNATNTTVIRYVDKATGHVSELNLDTDDQAQVSNVTIPQIAETLWGPNGKSLIFRYLKDGTTIRSFYGAINSNATGTKPAIEGIFLADNVRNMAASGGKILYFDPSVEGGRLIQAGMDGSKKSIIWSSDFGEWGLSWNGSKTALVYSKPSGTENGSAYIINLANGQASKVDGDMPGLQASLSPAGDYVFIASATQGGLSSEIYSVAKKTAMPLSIATIADKCAWANTEKAIYCGFPTIIADGLYPDDWYKGTTSFADKLWKINLSTGETTLVLDPAAEGLSEFDMTNLALDPSDSYIAFMNKKDMALWTYKIKQ